MLHEYSPHDAAAAQHTHEATPKTCARTTTRLTTVPLSVLFVGSVWMMLPPAPYFLPRGPIRGGIAGVVLSLPVVLGWGQSVSCAEILQQPSDAAVVGETRSNCQSAGTGGSDEIPRIDRLPEA